MAARWLAARRPRHRTSLPTQPARVRSLLFDRKLVSRLHRLLRRLRRRQEALRSRRPGRTSKGDPEKRRRRTRGNRRSRFRVSASSLGAYAHASHLSARRRSEVSVLNPKPRSRRSKRRGRTRRIAAASVARVGTGVSPVQAEQSSAAPLAPPLLSSLHHNHVETAAPGCPPEHCSGRGETNGREA